MSAHKLKGTTKTNVRLYIGVIKPQLPNSSLAPTKTVYDYATGHIEFMNCPNPEAFYKLFAGELITLKGSVGDVEITWIGKLGRQEKGAQCYYLYQAHCENTAYLPTQLLGRKEIAVPM